MYKKNFVFLKNWGFGGNSEILLSANSYRVIFRLQGIDTRIRVAPLKVSNSTLLQMASS